MNKGGCHNGEMVGGVIDRLIGRQVSVRGLLEAKKLDVLAVRSFGLHKILTYIHRLKNEWRYGTGGSLAEW